MEVGPAVGNLPRNNEIGRKQIQRFTHDQIITFKKPAHNAHRNNAYIFLY